MDDKLTPRGCANSLGAGWLARCCIDVSQAIVLLCWSISGCECRLRLLLRLLLRLFLRSLAHDSQLMYHCLYAVCWVCGYFCINISEATINLTCLYRHRFFQTYCLSLQQVTTSNLAFLYNDGIRFIRKSAMG